MDRKIVWLVRLALVAVAFAFLWLGQVADDRFRRTTASAFRFDLRLWSATITPLVLAGVAFTAAARYPFPRSRYAWGRLVLAALAIAPALHLGFVLWAPQFSIHWPAVLVADRWFDDGAVPSAAAVLAGIAVGGGIGARRGLSEP